MRLTFEQRQRVEPLIEEMQDNSDEWAFRIIELQDEVKRLRSEVEGLRREKAKEILDSDACNYLAEKEEENKRLREIVESLVEYADELLVDHLVRLGETTTKNRHIAESLREDIAVARAALRGEEEE